MATKGSGRMPLLSAMWNMRNTPPAVQVVIFRRWRPAPRRGMMALEISSQVKMAQRSAGMRIQMLAVEILAKSWSRS